MILVHIIGTIAAFASVSIGVIGFPAQIIKNHKRKSADGLSSIIIYSSCVAYFLWALYGWLKPDWFLAISQTICLALDFILLIQSVYYKK